MPLKLSAMQVELMNYTMILYLLRSVFVHFMYQHLRLSGSQSVLQNIDTKKANYRLLRNTYTMQKE